MEKCNLCSTGFLCAGCDKVRYCGTQDWVNHRSQCFKTAVHFEDLLPTIFQTFFESDACSRPINQFYGIHTIDGVNHWFFDEGETPEKIPRKVFWTTELCIQKPGSMTMTEEQFWLMESIDGCELFSIPLAVALQKLLKGQKRLHYGGERVEEIYVIRAHPNTDYVRHEIHNIGCPNPERLAQVKEEAEDLANNFEHMIIGFWMESGKILGVDLTALQLGITSKIREHYLHIERLTSLEDIPLEDCADPHVIVTQDAKDNIFMTSSLGKSSYATLLCVLEAEERFGRARGMVAKMFKELKENFVKMIDNL